MSKPAKRDKRHHSEIVAAIRRPLTAREVAKRCGVDLRTIHHWVAAGLIGHFRTPGRHLRFDVMAIDEFLASRSTAVEKNDDDTFLVIAANKTATKLRRALAALRGRYVDNPYTALLFAGWMRPRWVVVEPNTLRGLDAKAYAQALASELPESTIFWFGSGVSVAGLRLEVFDDPRGLRAALIDEESASKLSVRRSSSVRRGTSGRQSKS